MYLYDPAGETCGRHTSSNRIEHSFRFGNHAVGFRPELAIELARNGGLSFIFGSQPIASQAEMVRKVKKFKAGFVTSDSNLTPEHTLDDVLRLLRQTGHSTIGIRMTAHRTGIFWDW